VQERHASETLLDETGTRRRSFALERNNKFVCEAQLS